MALPSVFEQKASQDLLARLEQITAQSQPKWGTMDSAKLLAHLNVTYDLAYERIPNKLNFFMKLMMKLFVKDKVTNEVPYKQNERNTSFGVLSASQWSNMFYKHLDHHFRQFGV